MDKYQQQYENECTVISCLIQEPSLIQECRLSDGHFYGYNTKAIFKKILELHEKGEPVNVVTLVQSNSDDLFRMGGSESIQEIAGYSWSIHSYKHYETLVMQFNAVDRSLDAIREYTEKTKEIHRISDLNELKDKLAKIELNTSTKELSTIEKVKKRVEYLQSIPKEGLSGVETGFTDMNNFTDGWQNGDLIIIAARPSVGKTALSINMKMNAVLKDKNTIAVFNSAEMSEEGIIDRELSLLANVSVTKMRNPNRFFKDDDYKRYYGAIHEYETFHDRSFIWREHNVRDIRSKLRRLKDDNPGKKIVLYIDHLSHLKIDGKYQNRNLEIGAIVQELKDMAVEYGVPIVLLCQLSRAVEQQADKRPNMSHLRDSGEIEQIADVVIFIYREDYYNKHTDKPKTNITELLIEKNRQGKVGGVQLVFLESQNRFADIERRTS